MRKKMLSALLCTAVAAGMLAGCGGGQETGTKAAETKVESNAQGDAAAEKEIVTIKLSHNKDYVTIPEAVIEAGKRLNEKYAAEGKNIEVQFETDYQQIDWTDYHNNIVFSHKSGGRAGYFHLRCGHRRIRGRRGGDGCDGPDDRRFRGRGLQRLYGGRESLRHSMDMPFV